MPSLEMLRKLLDEFAEKEAQTREEINIITQRIDELEERVVESQQKLVHLGIDKEKVLRMKEVYKGAVNTWTGPTNVDGENEASPATVPAPASASRPTAAATPAPAVNSPAVTAPAVSAPAPSPQPSLQATTTQDSLRERLRPGRAGTNSMNNLEPIQAQPQPQPTLQAPTTPVSSLPPSSLPSGPPVSVAALSPRNTGTKMPAMQPPEMPPEVASPFTSEPAAVSSANPFNTPLFQAPENVPASASSHSAAASASASASASDLLAPTLEPSSAFAMSSQAEQASSAYSQPEAAGFPFPEQAPAPPAYSGVNETNYAQQQPAVQTAQPALQAQDAAENPFFRQVGAIRRETPPGPTPPLPGMPMDQPSTSPFQQATPESYPAQPAQTHAAPYDPYAAMQAAQQDPYSAMQAPQPDPYTAQADPYGLQQQDPQAQAPQESQPPQISDFEEDEPDDTMKSINDALRGLFR